VFAEEATILACKLVQKEGNASLSAATMPAADRAGIRDVLHYLIVPATNKPLEVWSQRRASPTPISTRWWTLSS
jgi:hypothetical protein